ncbi:1951_t:CDS:1, partial [Racocetra fulgida]
IVALNKWDAYIVVRDQNNMVMYNVLVENVGMFEALERQAKTKEGGMLSLKKYFVANVDIETLQ